MAKYNDKTQILEPHNIKVDKDIFKDFAKKYKLNERQVDGAFIAATEGVNKHAIARRLGITPTSVFKWFQNPNFIALYNDLCGAILKGMQGKALARMDKLIDNKSPNIGYKAAKFVITTNLDVVEGVDISRRDTVDELLSILSSPPEKEELVFEEGDDAEEYRVLFQDDEK